MKYRFLAKSLPSIANIGTMDTLLSKGTP